MDGCPPDSHNSERTTQFVERLLSPLRLPFRHGPEEADSTRDTEILEVVHKGDWGRLGVLLGGQDEDLGRLVSAWPSLSPALRGAVVRIASQ